MGVPYTFSTASQSIPLAQLDANFATPITLGTSTAALGQTVTTLNNLTLSNVTILSGSATLNNLTGNVTFGNTTVNIGNSSSSIGNLTLNNVQINSGNLSSAVIPTANGTVMLSGNMPAFSYYLGTNQSISTATFTKVQINTKEFDTANAFDAATNYRFQPTIAGYYQINGQVAGSATTATRIISFIYKNGTNYKAGSDILVPTGGVSFRSAVSTVIYLNGSTDYLELYGYLIGTGGLVFIGGNTYDCYFNGSLVRGS